MRQELVDTKEPEHELGAKIQFHKNIKAMNGNKKGREGKTSEDRPRMTFEMTLINLIWPRRNLMRVPGENATRGECPLLRVLTRPKQPL